MWGRLASVLKSLAAVKMGPDDLFGLDILQDNQPAERPKKVYKKRNDPMDMLNTEFKKHFRFSKDSVNRLTELLREDLEFANNRGLPVPPLEQVCITLNSFAGANFQRISGWCGGVSQNTARLCIVRVTDALVRRKSDFIFMPGVDEMLSTAERMLEQLMECRSGFGFPSYCPKTFRPCFISSMVSVHRNLLFGYPKFHPYTVVYSSIQLYMEKH